MNDQVWPNEKEHLFLARHWIAEVLGVPSVREAEKVLWVKSWGLTAKFLVDGSPFVFKDSSPVIFPKASNIYRMLNARFSSGVPKLVASQRYSNHEWSLFEYIEGKTVAESLSIGSATMFAERLAQIQMGVDFDESQHCPRYDVTCVPDELASDIDDQPIGIRTHFEYALPKLRALASELADTCPISLDHPDLNPSNGILSESGEVVIIDWEESAFGCALFSLDRLLDIDLLKSQKERNLVCDAYLGQLGLGRTTEVRRKWNISQCLVPLRRASEARYFARAMNRSNPHTRITGHLISKCLSRMEVAEL